MQLLAVTNYRKQALLVYLSIVSLKSKDCISRKIIIAPPTVTSFLWNIRYLTIYLMTSSIHQIRSLHGWKCGLKK